MPTRGFYAGSFDPITLGHIDIVEQALNIFDLVEIGIGRNPKKSRMFSEETSIDLIRCSIAEALGVERTERVTVSSYDGSIMRKALAINATAIVRGLRQVSDFNDEFTLHGVIERVTPQIPMVYMIGQQEFLHVSSSTAKELASLGEDMTWMVTPCVADALRRVYDQQ